MVSIGNKRRASTIAGIALLISGIPVLPGCSGSDISDASSPDTPEQVEKDGKKFDIADYGWMRCEIPEGYYDTHEMSSFPTFMNKENSDFVIKILPKQLFNSRPNAAVLADRRAESNNGTKTKFYTRDGNKEMGKRTWELVSFKWGDGAKSHLAYADINDKYAVEVASFMMPIDDPVVKQIIESLEIYPDKI